MFCHHHDTEDVKCTVVNRYTGHYNKWFISRAIICETYSDLTFGVCVMYVLCVCAVCAVWCPVALSPSDCTGRILMKLRIVSHLTLYSWRVYLYNWAAELCNTLDRQFLRLVQWHNARSQVLLSILSQKMGLFQHNSLKGISLGDLATSQTVSQCCQQTKH